MTDGFDLFGRQGRGQIFRIDDDVVIAEGVILGESNLHRRKIAIGRQSVKTELTKNGLSNRRCLSIFVTGGLDFRTQN